MATQADVRRLALALPGVRESTGGQWGFHVLAGGKEKGLAWVWLERVDPKKARVPQPAVLAVRVENEDAKDALIAGAPEKFFTEAHYNGYPAVLVRLAEVTTAELSKLLEDAHRIQAPKLPSRTKRTPKRATPKPQPKRAAPTRAKPRARRR